MPVHLVATGGTIASTGFPGPLAAARDGRALLADAGVTADVTVTDLATAGSFPDGVDDLRRLRTAVAEALDAGADGVVVTHGTDTMEESAYGLDLLLDARRPVVLTGAQRAADEPGADGPANLRTALALAADPATRGDGVLLCFDGEAFAARGVGKRHTLAAGAFRGPVVHRVVDGTVRRVAHPCAAPPCRSWPPSRRGSTSSPPTTAPTAPCCAPPSPPAPGCRARRRGHRQRRPGRDRGGGGGGRGRGDGARRVPGHRGPGLAALRGRRRRAGRPWRAARRRPRPVAGPDPARPRARG